MKIILTAFALVLSTSNLFATDLENLAGDYIMFYQTEVGPLPSSVISLKEDGTLTLVEFTDPRGDSFNKPFTCKGKARMVGEVVQSSMKCEDGKEYTQTIYDIEPIDDDNLSAEATSTLFPGEVAGIILSKLTEEARKQIEAELGPLPF